MPDRLTLKLIDRSLQVTTFSAHTSQTCIYIVFTGGYDDVFQISKIFM